MISGKLFEKAERLLYTARQMGWMADPRSWLPVPDLTIDRPVFLLGTQGGGLTLLARMLQRHPQVISGAGNCDYWTSANEIQNIYGPILPQELTGLRWKAPPHPVLTAPRSWTFAARDLHVQYRKTEQDATPELKAMLERVIRLSALRHAKNRKAFRFIDKSQVYAVRVALLYGLLKEYNPKFVLVPRDPYVSVYRAADGKAGDMKRLTNVLDNKQRIDICAEHYANSMRDTLEDCDRLGIPLHILPFETLLHEPEKSLRAVCDFCELDFQSDMLPAAQHRLPIGSRFRDRWYPLRTNVNTGYAEKLTNEDIAVVNRYCRDVIERLGYRRLDEKQAVA